jgi:hypothetical protein
MNLDFDDSSLVLAWGLTTVLGWAATAAMGLQTMTGGKVMAVWTVLMAVPVGMTAKLYYDGDSNKLFNFWAVAVTLLMIENFLTPGSIAVYSFFHLWYVAAIAGFYYTSTKLPPPSNKTYKYAAFLSVAGLAAVIYKPLAAAPLAVLLQGGPMIYDWYTVHR